MNCPKCKQKQWSIVEKKYLQRFNICGYCDEKHLANGLFSEEEFFNRVKQALSQRLSEVEAIS